MDNDVVGREGKTRERRKTLNENSKRRRTKNRVVDVIYISRGSLITSIHNQQNIIIMHHRNEQLKRVK